MILYDIIQSCRLMSSMIQNVSTNIQISCLLTCLFSHWGTTFWNTSAHLSTIRGRHNADKARCEASLSRLKTLPRRNSFEQLRTASNSFEQLGLSWTALSCFQMSPNSSKIQFGPNIVRQHVRTCPNCSAVLCCALLCSVMLELVHGEVSHGNVSLSHARSIAPLASPAHSKPMLNFFACQELAAGPAGCTVSYLVETYCNILQLLVKKKSRTV